MRTERAFVYILVAVSVILSLLVIRPYLTYVALALFLAYALWPVQRWLAPRIGARISAAVVMFGALVLFVIPLALLLQVVVMQALAVIDRVRSGDIDLRVAQEFLQTEIGQEIVSAVQSSVGSVLRQSAGVVSGVSSLALGATIFGFLLYYLLVDGEDLLRWFQQVTPLPRHVQNELLAELDRLAYAILITTLVIAVVQAILTGIALTVLGFSNVVFWTVLAVILGILPFVGSMFIWIPAAVFLVVDGRLVAGAALLAYGFGVVNLSDNYLRPVLGGRSANMNPGLLILGIFGGIAVFGVTGLFLGPIVLGFTRVVVTVAAREYG